MPIAIDYAITPISLSTGTVTQFQFLDNGTGSVPEFINRNLCVPKIGSTRGNIN